MVTFVLQNEPKGKFPEGNGIMSSSDMHQTGEHRALMEIQEESLADINNLVILCNCTTHMINPSDCIAFSTVLVLGDHLKLTPPDKLHPN